MSIVALFSGQGAQKVGMGKDFYESSATARALMDQADEILGYSLTSVMFEGPEEELTRTSRCQPALYLHGLVAMTLFAERVAGFSLSATAGLSLGEFTAHAAAKTFSFADGLRLVAKRGALMEEACEKTQGAMIALLGGEVDQIRALAAACDVDVANINAPGQIVLSGSVEGIQAVNDQHKEYGIRRAAVLNVAGAYHSRLMQSAQEQLAPELQAVSMQSPSVPVVCNFGASVVTEPSDIRTMLEKQVTGTVRWTESIETLRQQGHQRFIEFGLGKIIAGMVKKIDKDAEIISIEDLASLEAAVETWG
jgi:[acyl-carrier-protein] S-malonyltransferase